MNNETLSLLTGALIGIARATDGNSHLLTAPVAEFVAQALACREPDEAMLLRSQEVKRAMVPNCFQCAAPCGRTADYDMAELMALDPEERRKKLLLLDAVRSAAARPGAVQHGAFFCKALILIGMELVSPAFLDAALEEAEALLARDPS